MGKHQRIAIKKKKKEQNARTTFFLVPGSNSVSFSCTRILLFCWEEMRRMFLLYSCLKGSQICLNQRREVAEFFICGQLCFNHQQIPDTLVTTVRARSHSSEATGGGHSGSERSQQNGYFKCMKYNIFTCFSRSALAGLKCKPSSDGAGGGKSRAY